MEAKRDIKKKYVGLTILKNLLLENVLQMKYVTIIHKCILRLRKTEKFVESLIKIVALQIKTGLDNDKSIKVSIRSKCEASL